MISSFTTETAYLSLKLVGSLHKQELVGSLHKQTSPGIRTLIVMVTTNTTYNFEGRHL